MLLIGLAAWLLTLRHIYRVGTTWNDHAVAIVVSACFTMYALFVPGPVGIVGMVLLYALFGLVDRTRATPGWAWWGVAVPAQLAYAFALWSMPLAPLWVAWCALHGQSPWRPGPWQLPALAWATWNVLWTVLRRHHVTRHRVEGLPLRIVQLSDIHVSGLMHAPQLHDLITRTNALEPDLVLITGDHVTPFAEADPSVLFVALAQLRAPAFACLGNHDVPIAARLTDEFERIGIPMLVDRSIVHGPVQITGIDFRWSGLAAHVAELVRTVPPDPTRFRILLAHDPRVGVHVPSGAWQLVLSGHTHGGQVSTECVGVRWSLLRLFGARDAGWFRTGDTYHYVHAGNWLIGLPPRLGVGPEIAVFEP